MRRFPWHAILALLVGFGLGLVYSWIIAPRGVTDASPVLLRSDFKDSYRAAIAASYAATHNLPRARARLALLEDSNSAEALNAQAQRMMASGESSGQADQVAALALALDEKQASSPTLVPGTEIAANDEPEITETVPPPPPDLPIELTETPSLVETATVSAPVTPRPTQTAVPTLGAPFALTGQEEVCDANLPDGLLQVIVLNSNRRQMPGVKVILSWDGGEEQFFTGLKPELGNGYADYMMTPETEYTIQLAVGSDVATGLVAPTCQASNGETFTGGMKLTFQRP
jgi:hypothetical protein